MKEKVAQEIAKRVKDGEKIGVGTGSTVDAALVAIGSRVKKDGLRISVVPSSYQTALKCQEMGFQVLSSMYSGAISWGFDGADEVDPQLRLIKGRGGAMLQEKILASKCEKFVVIVDQSKMVSQLCEKCSVPVEVIPEALYNATEGLKALGATEIVRREAVSKHGPVITERGNIILDVSFSSVSETLEKEIKSIVGVVESGLFLNYTDEVIVAREDGVYSLVADGSGAHTETKLS